MGAKFGERLQRATERANSLVCVGLDPDPTRFPDHLRDERDIGSAIVQFNSGIIEATRDLVCAYKPNLGFYLAHGEAGVAALVATRRLIPPEIPVILDAKIGDIDSTAAAYAHGVFDVWGFDAVTVNPYLGQDSLAPFLVRADRGVIILCKTSNQGSGDLQNLITRTGPDEQPLYLAVADRIAAWAERAAATVGLVVGATYPAELAAIRARCPNLPILLPGIGAQGGDLETAVRAGLDPRHAGLIISSSRGIIHAASGPDFADRAREAAGRLRNAINAAREFSSAPAA
jgi:orotidine-5'-phosphate decarboxylase